MTSKIPSPHIPKLQARNISPIRLLRNESPDKTVSTLTSLILADHFQERSQKENRNEEAASQHGSPVKTIHQLREGFKALSEKLHHSKSEHEASITPRHSPGKEPAVWDSAGTEAALCYVVEDRSISQLEKWSDDELPQAEFGNVLGMSEERNPSPDYATNPFDTLPLTLVDDSKQAIDTPSRKTSETYSSEFPYLAPGMLPPFENVTRATDNLLPALGTAAGTDHKLRQYIARPLTDKITEDLDYLKEELQYLRFRYIDTEVSENVQNMEVALKEGNQALLVDEKIRFEAATECLKAGIDDAVGRAHNIIVWRVQVEIENLIKSLT